uniref:Uncharacterized protein n=1 Tax=uncultured prokaryote TaxID=198431 RepID=A0A0H5Q5U5_9ZZZZ|nr:hypothetical protein [uncultured prokaryote]
MGRPKTELEGVHTSRTDLVVVIAVGEGAARRICNVHVPIADLLETNVGHLISREAARSLIAAWTDVPLDWE